MSNAETLDARLLQAFPLPEVPEDSGKEDRGRLLVVAGRAGASDAGTIRAPVAPFGVASAQ